MGSTITLNHLGKTYASGHRAVHDVSLHLNAGEFLVLLGPSGCGKSTLLRMIAGLETITEGRLLLNQQPANDLPPSERDVAMIFQNFALYPTMTAAQNIAFPLAARGEDEHSATRAVHAVADRLGIRSLLTRTPARLSGGERQRVAMGRAIIRHPAVFLMDEPLSSLDARLRVRLRAEILSIVRRIGATTVYVTHDQAEAMALGDRIAVLRDGVLQQIGTPDELYNLPANAFVASFVGTPRINLLHGTLYAPIEGPMTLSMGTQHLVLPTEMTEQQQHLRVVQGQPLLVGLRPEALRVGSATTAYERPLSATVTHVEYQGHESLLHVTVGAVTADPPRTAFDHEDRNETGNMLSAAARTLLSRVRSTRPAPSPVTAEPAPPLPQHYQGGELVLRAPQGVSHSLGDRLPLLVDIRSLMLFDGTGHRVFPHPTHVQAF
ncbi:ABC transporter ATP-binding protein [Streptomyces sp. NPDC050703]|uniref:ABC transporter ATP-binding protein n=1 Tax=Streptomyces sp. NPDC050703 TaxID=3157218 RepID=UPI0034324EB4